MAEIIFHPDTVLEIKSSYEWYQQESFYLFLIFFEIAASISSNVLALSLNLKQEATSLMQVFLNDVLGLGKIPSPVINKNKLLDLID